VVLFLFFQIPDITKTVEELAEIFKPKPVITPWQLAVNKAASQLVGNDPSLLRDRQSLFSRAREEAALTYDFKKGKSRSVQMGKTSQQHNNNQSDGSQKHAPHTNSDLRNMRIKQLKEEIEFQDHETIKLKKNLTRCEVVKDHERCLSLRKEIQRISSEKNLKQLELHELERSNYKSNWYFKNRAGKSSATCSKSIKKRQKKNKQEILSFFKSSSDSGSIDEETAKSVTDEMATNSTIPKSVTDEMATASIQSKSVTDEMATDSVHPKSVIDELLTDSTNPKTVIDEMVTDIIPNKSVIDEIATDSTHPESVTVGMVTDIIPP